MNHADNQGVGRGALALDEKTKEILSTSPVERRWIAGEIATVVEIPGNAGFQWGRKLVRNGLEERRQHGKARKIRALPCTAASSPAQNGGRTFSINPRRLLAGAPDRV